MAKINKQAGNKPYREQGEHTIFNLEYNLPRKITEDTNNFTNNVLRCSTCKGVYITENF